MDSRKRRPGGGLQSPCPVESPLTGLTSQHTGALLNEYNQCLTGHQI
jgi:hypothetical protein